MMKPTDSSQIKIQYISISNEESGKIMIDFVHEVSVKLRISNGNKKTPMLQKAPKGKSIFAKHRHFPRC